MHVNAAGREQMRRRIMRLCGAPTDAMTLRLEILHELAPLGFDTHAWLLTDPITTVGCAPLADAPSLAELPQLIRLKYLTELNRWTHLGHEMVARLSAVTGGDLSASMLWRDLLCHYDVCDVVSLVFVDSFGCWGFLDLWRSGRRTAFTDEDASLLAALCPVVTAALRRCQAQTFLVPGTLRPTPAGPVVLLLSSDLRVQAQTPETERYLRVLVPPSASGSAIPAIAYNVGAQLLAAEAGVDRHDPSARTHLADGVWITARAARMGGDTTAADRNIAVSIEPTTTNDRLSLFGLAFGLSAREREVLTLLAAGMDTRELAGRMFVSQHTVQDHLKSIFARTGLRTRRTLLSAALGS